MDRTQLDDKFKDEAARREEIARAKCGHRPGRFQAMAQEQGALNAAIGLIENTQPFEGLVRLFICSKERYKPALKLSIEQIFIEFAEKYGGDFLEIFKKEIIEIAKRKLSIQN